MAWISFPKSFCRLSAGATTVVPLVPAASPSRRSNPPLPLPLPSLSQFTALAKPRLPSTCILASRSHVSSTKSLGPNCWGRRASYYATHEAKGPQGAPWNTGVFSCIRCAELGDRICRVKPVNLYSLSTKADTVHARHGKYKASLLHENSLPENCRGPSTWNSRSFQQR